MTDPTGADATDVPADGVVATRPAAEAGPATGTPDDGGGVSFPGLRVAGLVGGLALIGWLNPWMLLVIMALVVMITLHEFGHYFMAKRAGMQVTEFFLFFGPKVWSFKRGETEYGIKCIPAGAYVRITGMHNLEEVPAADEAMTYRQKSFGQRIGVAVAGSSMHFLMAIGLIFVALTVVGQPGGTLIAQDQAETWLIGEVVEGSGASEGGLEPGDRITEFGGVDIDTFDDLKDAVAPRRGSTVPVTYQRGDEVRTTRVDIRPYSYRGQTSTGLGVIVDYPDPERVSPLVGLVRAPKEFVQVTVTSVQALGSFFSPSGITDFAGQVGSARQDRADSQAPTTTAPPSAPSNAGEEEATPGENRVMSIWGLIRFGSDAGAVDPSALIALFAFVNIFIGVFNLLPMLPFDGGHVVIAVYEKIQEKRLSRRRYFADVGRLMPVTYVVVLLLGALFLSSLYLDIANPLEIQ